MESVSYTHLDVYKRQRYASTPLPILRLTAFPTPQLIRLLPVRHIIPVSYTHLDDGTVYKEVTPQDYVEGPFMLKRNGKYYFMCSEGGLGSPDYRVAYAIADSPFGPFHREGIILQQDAGRCV